MKRPDIFKRTVNTLATAYLQSFLNPSDCAACAVGNICAEASGYKVVSRGSAIGDQYDWVNKEGEVVDIYWPHLFMCGEIEMGQKAYEDIREVREEVDATGYTWKELHKIEKTFMNTYWKYHNIGGEENLSKDESIFKSLMAVLDVLFDIHEVKKEEQPAYRETFKQQPQLT